MHPRRRRRDRQTKVPVAGAGPRPTLRIIAVGAAGLMGFGIAYQAAFADHRPGHDPVPRGRGQGYARGHHGGLSDAESLAIALGVPVAVLGGLYFFGASADDDDDDQARSAPAPAPGVAGTQARLVPGVSALRVGGACAFDLQVKDARGKWQSVSDRPEVSFALSDSSAGLVLQKGTKNVFCVPVTAGGLAGKTVTVSASYAPEGGKALTARADIAVADL